MSIHPFFMAIPLIVAVSLVYAATRAERLREIFEFAFHTAVWILGFLGCVFVAFWAIT